MDLQDTLEKYVMQLKNTPRTLEAVVSVCRKIMATLYDHYFPGAEALRPGPTSRCPDSDILTLTWVLELIGKDSELSGYKLIKAQLGHLFAYLPERSRFNRRRRNLCHASEKLRRVLIQFLPDDEVFIRHYNELVLNFVNLCYTNLLSDDRRLIHDRFSRSQGQT